MPPSWKACDVCAMMSALVLGRSSDLERTGYLVTSPEKGPFQKENSLPTIPLSGDMLFLFRGVCLQICI